MPKQALGYKKFQFLDGISNIADKYMSEHHPKYKNMYEYEKAELIGGILERIGEFLAEEVIKKYAKEIFNPGEKNQ